jgi:hypothetical protein
MFRIHRSDGRRRSTALLRGREFPKRRTFKPVAVLDEDLTPQEKPTIVPKPHERTMSCKQLNQTISRPIAN